MNVEEAATFQFRRVTHRPVLPHIEFSSLSFLRCALYAQVQSISCRQEEM